MGRGDAGTGQVSEVNRNEGAAPGLRESAEPTRGLNSFFLVPPPQTPMPAADPSVPPHFLFDTKDPFASILEVVETLDRLVPVGLRFGTVLCTFRSM